MQANPANSIAQGPGSGTGDNVSVPPFRLALPPGEIVRDPPPTTIWVGGLPTLEVNVAPDPTDTVGICPNEAAAKDTFVPTSDARLPRVMDVPAMNWMSGAVTVMLSSDNAPSAESVMLVSAESTPPLNEKSPEQLRAKVDVPETVSVPEHTVL